MMNRLIFGLILLLFLGCSYKFNGASIPPEMKTVSIPFFENNAPLVDPSLSQKLTEAFKDRIRTQSKLNITISDAHGKFEGTIKDYDIKPISIQDNTNPIAGANRLTISVEVKYTNTLKGFEKQNFTQLFTAFTDFSLAGQSLTSQQEGLNKKVIDQLTENIFNRAFAQW